MPVKSKWAMVTVTVVFLAAQAAVMLMLANKGRHDYIRSVATDTGFWVVYTVLEARYGWPFSSTLSSGIIATCTQLPPSLTNCSTFSGRIPLRYLLVY